LLIINTQALAQYIKDYALKDAEDLSEIGNEIAAEELLQLPDVVKSAGNQESEDVPHDSTDEPYPYIIAKFTLIIPPETPPFALLASIIQKPSDEQIPFENRSEAVLSFKPKITKISKTTQTLEISDARQQEMSNSFNSNKSETLDAFDLPKTSYYARFRRINTIPWQASFLAGPLAVPAAKLNTQIIDKAKLLRCLRQGVKIHQLQLPAVPKEHEKLINYSFEALFLKAEADHLKSYKDMNSWTVISRKDPRAENH
jgi:hypothetical protein